MKNQILSDNGLRDLRQAAMPHDQISVICADALKIGLGHLSGEAVARLKVGLVEESLEHLARDAVELCPANSLRCVYSCVWTFFGVI